MPPPVYRHRPPRHAKVTAQAQAARRRQGRQGCRTGCRRRTRYGTGRQRHAKAKDAARQRTPPPPRMPPPYMIRHRHAKATAQARKAARHAARHARPHAAARCRRVYARIVYIRLHTCKPEKLLNARKKWAEKFAKREADVDEISRFVPICCCAIFRRGACCINEGHCGRRSRATNTICRLGKYDRRTDYLGHHGWTKCVVTHTTREDDNIKQHSVCYCVKTVQTAPAKYARRGGRDRAVCKRAGTAHGTKH